MRTKPGARPALPLSSPGLYPDTYEQARLLAPGRDIYALESEWRDWIAKKCIVPRMAEKHFLACCKRKRQHLALL